MTREEIIQSITDKVGTAGRIRLKEYVVTNFDNAIKVRNIEAQDDHVALNDMSTVDLKDVLFQLEVYQSTAHF